MSTEFEEEDRLLRLSEVMALTGLGRSTIYNLMAKGLFPLSREVPERGRRWLRSEVKKWIDSLPKATNLLKGQVLKEGTP